jgi:hypothetical protein
MVILPQELRFNIGRASCKSYLAIWTDQATLARVASGGGRAKRPDASYATSGRLVYL